MPGRPFTHRELRLAREMRSQGCTLGEIALALHRDSARQLQRHLGPSRSRHGYAGGLTPSREAMIRQHASCGILSQAQLARDLDVAGAVLRLWLAKLGIPALAFPDGRRQPGSGAAGLDAAASVLYERRRAACAALGWPEASHPAHARILSLLEVFGPLTRQQIALRLDCRKRPRLSARLALLIAPLRHPQAGPRGAGMVTRLPPAPRTNAPRYAVASWLAARRAQEV